MKTSSAAGENKQIPNLTTIVSGIILLYSVLLFSICPTPDLAFAIGLEFAALLLIAVPTLRVGPHLPLFSWPQKALDKLAARFPWVARVQDGWRKLMIVAAFLLISAALIDLTAMWLAVAGFMPGAVTLYSALPVSYLVGNHPAFSLEMLTGACVQSHQYGRAEQLYKAVLQVRKNVYGAGHPMVAAVYADLGDLYKKMNRVEDAQECYRTSLAITEGKGRAVHSLANLLRDSGAAEESGDFYKRALELRQHFFGTNSPQYQATLNDYRLMTEKGLNRPN